jgi:hypothetical protein
MGVDFVQPSFASTAVQPKRDANEDGQSASRRAARSRQQRKLWTSDAEGQPVVNSLGQVTGQTIYVVV